MSGNIFSGSDSLKNIKWRKMSNNNKDVFPVEKMLRDLENDYVSACAKFLARDISKDNVWILPEPYKALIVFYRSTVVPVFCSLPEIPPPKFLNNFFMPKVHSIQGFKEEVILLEKFLVQSGRKISDIFDYDLMDLEQPSLRLAEGRSTVSNLVLRVPRFTDLDALAPLQAAYEHEEVLHKGSVFSPAASRISLEKIIKDGIMLVAEVNGRIVGKINVSGISFTKYLVGGVFVHPDFRGKGIAGNMTSKFINSLTAGGRGVTLFVKKSNIAARKLYLRLGFKVRGDYRITYFYN